MRLQRQDLIKRIRVVAAAIEIPSDTGVDGEDGHGQFRADRNAHRELLFKRRPEENNFLCVQIGAGDMVLDIGAFVVLGIQRKTRCKMPVYMI